MAEPTPAGIRCPGCQHENANDAIFCERCGRLVGEFAGSNGAEGVSAAQRPRLSGEKGCANCGHSNVAAAVFCERCACRLDQPRAESLIPPRPTRTRRSPAGLVAAAVVLAGLLLVVVVLVSLNWGRSEREGIAMGPGKPSAREDASANSSASGEQPTPGDEAQPSPASGGSRWYDAPPMPTPRSGHVAVAVGGSVYAIGGIGRDGATGANEAYTVQANRWCSCAVMPTPRSSAAASGVGNTIYVVGGLYRETVLDIVESYDAGADGWSKRHAPLPIACAGAGAVTADGQLYVVGGLSGDGQPVPYSWRYDPQADSWTQLPDMLTARAYPGVAVVAGRVHAVGGITADGSGNTVECYDTIGARWKASGDAEAPTGGLGAAVVDGIAYLVGRVPSSSSAVSADFLDSSGPMCKAISDVPSPARAGAAIVGVGGGFLVLGGYDAAKKEYLNDVHFYRP